MEFGNDTQMVQEQVMDTVDTGKKGKKKKEKKEKEPQYYYSATNMQTYNYKVYYMNTLEKVGYFILAFVVGAAVGYLFFGGLAKDEYGDPTMTTYLLNVLICGMFGTVSGFGFIPIRTQMIIDARTKKLKTQFRDMLEALNTSLGAGKNVTDSFHAVYDDLKVQYDENAFIIKEMEVILSCMANNVDIEVPLEDFGVRSGIGDIVSFANVFKICYHKGGNIKDTIRNTHAILSEKMEISEEIETVVTGAKSEQNLMIVMPILLIGMIKLSSPDFAANFATMTGILSSILGIIMFVVAYFVGRSILNIKV